MGITGCLNPVFSSLPVAWHSRCRSAKEAAPPSDSDPEILSEMMADEPTAPAASKRESGTAGKKQQPAQKEFELFDEDMDDGGADVAATSKRRRHGQCSCYLLTYLHLSPST